MRNRLLFIVLIISYNSFLFAELTKAQFWAISLAGMMTEMNRYNRNTLKMGEMTESNKKIWLELLRRDWGVNNREELLRTMDTTENLGHASSLRLMKQIISEMADQSFSVFDIYKKYELSDSLYNRLKFTITNWNMLRNRTLNEDNHLMVERTDDNGSAKFGIFFNKNLAATFVDNEPLNGVRVGLVTSVNVLEKEMFPHIPVDVRFDY